MKVLGTFEQRITSLAASPDGAQLAVASGDVVAFVDLATGARRDLDVEGATRIAWGANGAVAGTRSGAVVAVSPEGAEQLLHAVDDDQVSGIAVSPTGAIAVCGGELFAVAVYDATGTERWRNEPYKWPYCVRFSSDGTALAITTWEGFAHVIATAELEDVSDLDPDADADWAGGPAFDAAFLPDGTLAVAAETFVKVLDPKARAFVRSVTLPSLAVTIAASPDGQLLVAGTNDQHVHLLRASDLAVVGSLALGDTAGGGEIPDYAPYTAIGGGRTATALAAHPDGKRAFAGTDDGQLIEITYAELGSAGPVKKATKKKATTKKAPAKKKPARGKPKPPKKTTPKKRAVKAKSKPAKTAVKNKRR